MCRASTLASTLMDLIHSDHLYYADDLIYRINVKSTVIIKVTYESLYDVVITRFLSIYLQLIKHLEMRLHAGRHWYSFVTTLSDNAFSSHAFSLNMSLLDSESDFSCKNNNWCKFIYTCNINKCWSVVQNAMTTTFPKDGSVLFTQNK